MFPAANNFLTLSFDHLGDLSKSFISIFFIAGLAESGLSFNNQSFSISSSVRILLVKFFNLLSGVVKGFLMNLTGSNLALILVNTSSINLSFLDDNTNP